MTMVGTTAALIYILPQRGVWVGVATALSTTFLLGAELPAIEFIGEWMAGNTDERTEETSP